MHGLLLEGVPSFPMVTVKNEPKWYALYVVHPDGQVSEYHFGHLEPYAEDQSAYRDHVPNPAVVQKWADSQGFGTDCCAMAMILGRWLIESLGYDEALAKFGQTQTNWGGQ